MQNIHVEIAEDTQNLILEDLNVRNMSVKDFNQDCHIICIPGGNLEMTTSVVTSIPVDLKLADVIITSGMCDLSAKSTPVIQICLNALNRLNFRNHLWAPR